LEATREGIFAAFRRTYTPIALKSLEAWMHANSIWAREPPCALTQALALALTPALALIPIPNLDSNPDHVQHLAASV
jgi:hypothetical protein